MKTKKCRPILIETNEKNSLLWSYKGRRLYYNQANFNDLDETIYYQLILISLEDEKIVNGDSYYNELNCTVNTYKSYPNKHNYNSKKVIATQDQLSPEYIQKFINEYNKGEVKDIRIEMVYMVGDSELTFGNSHITPSLKPKLTNGFVTIVEKKQTYFPIKATEDTITLYGAGKFQEEKLVLDRTKASLLFIELWKFLEIRKEPILYTEEEVWNVIVQSILFRNKSEDWYSELPNWFDQNKKK